MKLKVLASSSLGNCYILETFQEKLIIECGINVKEVLKGMNFYTNNVVGCVISHSHLDHSVSADKLAGLGIDIYASKETISILGLKGHRFNHIEPLKQFTVGNFIILPFPTEHDCDGSMGFLIQYKLTGEKLLFITDSYYCKYKFKGLNYIMIECNYIKETLDANIEAGYIHEAMKSRLLQSHFSLENVKKFLMANDLSQCREIILLHLSDSNSNALRMVKEIKELTGIKPVVADTGLEVSLEMFPY